MAYRRKQAISRSATFVEDHRSSRPHPTADDLLSSSPPSLAAQAIRASAAHRESSASAAFSRSATFVGATSFSSDPDRPTNSQKPTLYEHTSLKGLDEPKQGFWGVLARKAKAMLDENGMHDNLEDHGRDPLQTFDSSAGSQPLQSRWSYERYRKPENPALQKGPDAINSIGGRIRNALEEGLTIVENKTADIIHEKLQIGRKASSSNLENQDATMDPANISGIQATQESRLKASRDVANAMTAKAKLLMRVLKTVKADLAFAKERCAQLEEENKILREGRDKGDDNEDEDLIRLQLETLLAEKARLARENSVYARENRFLREIVEFHQLKMQNVVHLDDDIEGDADGYDIKMLPNLSSSQPVREVSPAQFSPRSSNASIASRSASRSPANGSSPPHTAIETPPEETEVGSSPSPPPDLDSPQRSLAAPTT